jgi:hypothetical protein
MLHFVKFVATKKCLTKIFFSPLSFLIVFGSGIRDPRSGIRDPGWVKIRIRDKHPGSAILVPTVNKKRSLKLNKR